MWWTYTITATSQTRLLMRVAQVFDQQLLRMTRLVFMDGEEAVEINLTVEAGEGLARRLQAKLYRLQDVRTVELSEAVAD